jgi:hypothetical protein
MNGDWLKVGTQPLDSDSCTTFRIKDPAASFEREELKLGIGPLGFLVAELQLTGKIAGSARNNVRGSGHEH